MRKDIVIEVSVPNESYEQWEQVDISKDQKMTLQFISNLLTGVESITSSSTLSVKLPRTARNERIFDFATRPQYESTMTHRKIPCHVYINGMDMMRAAYCYLLDSESDSYEVCIVFGLLQNYGVWIDAGRSIRELEDNGESVEWNNQAAWTKQIGGLHPVWLPAIWYGNDANINTYTPQNGLGRLMYYGIYNPGFKRDNDMVDYANVHPFVTLREIWERIISENSLNFVLPTWVKLDMENLAIVLTTIKGNTPEGNQNSFNIETDGSIPSLGQIGNYYYFRPDMTESGYIEEGGHMSFKIKSKGNGHIMLNFHMKLIGQSVEWAMQRLNNDPTQIRLLSSDLIAGTTSYLTPTYQYDSNDGWILVYNGTLEFEGSEIEGQDIGALQFRVPKVFGGFDNFYNYFSAMKVEGYQVVNHANVVSFLYYDGTHNYPNRAFRCFPNLPDIKQLDFVKMICQLYCLFPIVNNGNTEQVVFVPFDVLNEAIAKGPDWSDKLLERMRDVPNKTSFRLGDYAKRNIIQYKEDEKDPVTESTRTGALFVNDDTLQKEKVLLEFPLAASEGNTINQYKINTVTDNETDPPTVTYEAEFTECVHRLMRVIEWYNYALKTQTRLHFSDLSVPYILQTYYATYQAAITKPRIITERIRLNELEMRDVDFRLPVYLRKYGRFYAIKQIQWTVGDEYAEVELLQLA